MAENTLPDMFVVELVNQQPSGIIKDGTKGMPWEEQKMCAETHTIPSTGLRAIFKTDENGDPVLDKDGKKIRVGVEEIQWIEGQDEIVVAKQREMGLLRPNSDVPIHGRSRIIITKGYRQILKGGVETGLSNYMRDVFWNVEAEGRSEKSTGFFKTSNPLAAVEKQNSSIFEVAEAVFYCKSLTEKVGDKWVYKEDRIDAIMHLFNLGSERPTYESKLTAILTKANTDPVNFLNLAKKLDQVTVTEVKHAIELGIIKIEKNSFPYVNKDKILHALGLGNFSEDKKIAMLCDYLQSKDGFQDWAELRAEVQAAKEKLNEK